MKLRAKVKDGHIVLITLVSEDEQDKAVLKALFEYEVTRDKLIFKGDRIIAQAKVSPFRRK